MGKAKDKPLRFEDAVAQLQAVIERIESGQVGLEDSLQQYEQGMKLVRHCRAVLDAAEKKVAELTVDEHGRLRGGQETQNEVAAEPDDEPGAA